MISKELIEEFKLIGIDYNRVDECTIREASLAYRRVAKVLHPDKVGPEATADDIAAATTAFQALGNAYESVITFLVN